jgi:hypothetical protein
MVERRRFAGCDIDRSYVAIATDRIAQLNTGAMVIRPLDRPIFKAKGTEEVARRPAHFH